MGGQPERVTNQWAHHLQRKVAGWVSFRLDGKQSERLTAAGLDWLQGCGIVFEMDKLCGPAVALKWALFWVATVKWELNWKAKLTIC